MSNITTQQIRRLWPIEMAPLSLEITFAPPGDAVIGFAADHPVGQPSSQNYVVKKLHLQCSQVLVDSALNNSFKNLLSSGRSLTISLQSVFTQAHVLATGSNSAQISMVRRVALSVFRDEHQHYYTTRSHRHRESESHCWREVRCVYQF